MNALKVGLIFALALPTLAEASFFYSKVEVNCLLPNNQVLKKVISPSDLTIGNAGFSTIKIGQVKYIVPHYSCSFKYY